jgi:hypothetical protein
MRLLGQVESGKRKQIPALGKGRWHGRIKTMKIGDGIEDLQGMRRNGHKNGHNNNHAAVRIHPPQEWFSVAISLDSIQS